MNKPPGRIPFVLVVEDDAEIADLLKNVLSDSYAVECVGDAPAALSRLHHGPADVVLLDCLLPGGGCSDVLEVARSRGCPVVPMSGLPEILAELAAFGYPCLQKPFKIAELMESIEGALSRRGGASR